MIRPIRESDYKELNELRREENVMKFILSLAAETVEETRKYFTESSHTMYTFVYDKEDLAVGYIKIQLDNEPKKRHKACISIAVSTQYQCNGVGRNLLNEAIIFSKNWLLLKRLELTVLKINSVAIKLYEKMGFIIVGTLPEDCVVDGKLEDVYIMSLNLSEAKYEY